MSWRRRVVVSGRTVRGSLCVMAADAAREAGRVETRAPFVRVAYLVFSGQHACRPRNSAWVAVCRLIREAEGCVDTAG